MIATYRARYRLKIGTGYREPGELVPEAHTWLRPMSFVHMGRLLPVEVDEVDFRFAVHTLCRDSTEAILAVLHLSPGVSLVKGQRGVRKAVKKARRPVVKGQPVPKKAVKKAARAAQIRTAAKKRAGV